MRKTSTDLLHVWHSKPSVCLHGNFGVHLLATDLLDHIFSSDSVSQRKSSRSENLTDWLTKICSAYLNQPVWLPGGTRCLPNGPKWFPNSSKLLRNSPNWYRVCIYVYIYIYIHIYIYRIINNLSCLSIKILFSQICAINCPRQLSMVIIHKNK